MNTPLFPLKSLSLTSCLTAACFCAFAEFPGVLPAVEPASRLPDAAVGVAPEAPLAERLAAREIRRYLYLRTGNLPQIIEGNSFENVQKSLLILVGSKSWKAWQPYAGGGGLARAASLGPGQYLLKTASSQRRRHILVLGGDSTGTLYGAYRLAEHLGVRFYLHGDVIPDRRLRSFPSALDERGKPLFQLRGILPFHDFNEGPDFWSLDDYKAVLSQLPKLRMNFIGFHTYAEHPLFPEYSGEPTVWMGLAGHVGEDGHVRGGYPASYQNTARAKLTYGVKKTGDYYFGARELFETDWYGSPVQGDRMPWPTEPEDCRRFFNEVGGLLDEAFRWAGDLGIKTCLGTEMPLSIPRAVREELQAMGKNPADTQSVEAVYRGIFTRIARAHPLDYYWLWTREGWRTPQGPNPARIEAVRRDLLAALAAAEEVDVPFTLSTSGWVLGPVGDRTYFDRLLPKSMPMSCLNRDLGTAPVEPAFARLGRRSRWAIPWLEDDIAMNTPQLWVGRLRKDAADALRYGCDGLVGIHWRTWNVGPQVAALAQAAWNQSGWQGKEGSSPKAGTGAVGGAVARFSAAVADTEDDPLYQSVRYGMEAYRLALPDGKYTVKLHFSEPFYTEAGKRRFQVRLQGKPVIENLDIFARVGPNRALVHTFEDVEVVYAFLNLDFVAEKGLPCIAAIEAEGPAGKVKINCGGPAHGDFLADKSPEARAERSLPVRDFYRDWTEHQFGPEAAEELTALFARLDGNLHYPARICPGGISIEGRPWKEIRERYQFIDELERLRPRIEGIGHRARYDHWLNTFRYARAMARLGCRLGELERVMHQVAKEDDVAKRRVLATEAALPLRQQLLQDWAEMTGFLLAGVGTLGELGNVMTNEQLNLAKLKRLTEHDEAIRQALGGPLPPSTRPWQDYRGPSRIIVPTNRTSLDVDEALRLKVIVLSKTSPQEAVLRWRPLGQGDFHEIPLRHVARGVYRVTLPAQAIAGADFEYYLRVTTGEGETLVEPPTAPASCRTVVVLDYRVASLAGSTQ